ncbi:MAG: hypothetical protein AUK53_00165 [Betaproteobacteria bacterium CG2_30_59_46]|nr:MAG: hypothetical protein AUK53_00165 [Betaproteobacteria bacterium CG2_30_59_46]PIQ13998.1 MAG: electron transporter RnfE [Hydrogenophilales bacterium CG18_big_fil_WC_8_21_14_2_50_58_12]PIX99675.1 MAG: electron transporter RnfE [Hydrogenophilales bacterium CG_4_10_14_3_um_filter_58_23]PJB08302.1 MAG: electron transporter RnfE [Hydrogenophilales bacterium CG_4_9_14_3_um_filter_59_35]
MVGWDHGGWMMGGSGGWMMVGWLWMMLVWLIPILLLFALVKYLFGKTRHDAPREEKTEKTALDIIRERYARGEIDQEEFQRKMRDLEGG